MGQLKMLKVPAELEPWFQDAIEELAAQHGPDPAEQEALAEALKARLDDEGWRILMDFDNVYSELLCFYLDLGFSIGFQLGCHPELLLGELAEG